MLEHRSILREIKYSTLLQPSIWKNINGEGGSIIEFFNDAHTTKHVRVFNKIRRKTVLPDNAAKHSFDIAVFDSLKRRLGIRSTVIPN